MRPRTLDEFVGQEPSSVPDGALKVVQPGYLPSMVLWGPPGSGKTTLARLLADRVGGTWRQISAVTSGVADIRSLVADARALRQAGGRTVGLSSTSCIASTRASRTPCCRTSRTARSS